LDFYAQRGHQVLPSASLVPEDPTVLLTIAGMLPFKPYFLGQRTPPAARVTTSQKCVRTNDIENVGRTARHHTFFEMLGNFSFGDYFKEHAIAWAWELSTQAYGLPPERLIPTVYQDDEEAFAIWRDRVGVPAERIFRMDAEENFWAAGPTGPCGPCSELYYDLYPEHGGDIDLEDDSRFIEFYNLVFMEYNRDGEGNLEPLQNKNIDTGLGLERMAQILQGVPNNYETDLIFPIIRTTAEIAGIDYAQSDEPTRVSLKVIGDHVRALIHTIADGVTASNVGRGYVLRRLLRRVVRHGRTVGIEGSFLPQVAETAISLVEDHYPHVRQAERTIKAELQREEERFLATLARGEKILAEILADNPSQISGRDAFVLYDTYGFPLELTQEIAAESGLEVDLDGFEREMEAQRQRSQAAQETIDLTQQDAVAELAQQLEPTEFVGYSHHASQVQVAALLAEGQRVGSAQAGESVQVVLDRTPFYAESGGQIGDRGYLWGEDVVVRIEDVQKAGDSLYLHLGRVERGTLQQGMPASAQIDRACRRRAQAHHTATHLLHAALKQLIDPSISQAGSLVAFDRLRFDFNCPHALSQQELQQLEDQINTWIAEAHPTQEAVLPFDEAKAQGAIAMFGEKYGDRVRVIDVPGVSMELCGGTHVNNTAEIGLFKITAETGISSGVRRIEAVAGPAVLAYLNERDRIVRQLSEQFKAQPEAIPQRVSELQAELKSSQKAIASLKQELAVARSEGLLSQAETAGDAKLLVTEMEGADPEALKSAAERLQHKLGESAVVLGSVPEAGKVSLVAAFSPGLNERGLQAGQFIGGIAQICGGGGGGRPHLAQAGGRDPSQLSAALQRARERLHAELAA